MEEKKSIVKKEIYGVFYFAFSILLALAFYAPQKWTGPIGAFTRRMGVSLLGTIVYVVPALFIYLAIEYFLEDESKMTHLRFLCVGLILLSASGIINILAGPDLAVLHPGPEKYSAFSLIGELWQSGAAVIAEEAASIWSGGLIGGLIGLGLKAVAGETGAAIILAAMIFALLVLIFNVSYRAYVRRSARVIKDAQMRMESSIRSSIENKRERYNEQAYFDELGDINYLKNRRRGLLNLEADKNQEQTDAEQIRYQLPGGDLRGKDQEDNPEIDYPMYKKDLDYGANGAPYSHLTYPSFDQSGQALQLAKKGISPTDERDQALASTMGAASSPDDHSRDSWTDRGDQTAGTRKVRSSKSGEQISLFTEYKAFPLSLLAADKYKKASRESVKSIQDKSKKLEETLQSFGVEAKVTNFISGPTLTRFELTPGLGVKVSRIVNLSDDIALNLAAYGVRIEAPIPGKSAIGIEIPNKHTQPVLLRPILEEQSFIEQSKDNHLLSVIGRDVSGKPIYCDISKMPHLLIAGATGAGKSVCINSMLISLLYHSSPQDLRLLLIDPKVVELSVYNGIPHLLQPVVTDPKKAYGVLNWAVMEMDRRYNLFAERQVREIKSYNDVIKHFSDEDPEYLPLVLIVIDELADLMATTSKEVEDAIQRLMAKARAAGIHVIIATQRPSVDVITGVIKANIPSRIAFSVASQVDSRTILDTGGAEKLLGKGDLLYFPQSRPKAMRGQGAFVTDSEVENVLNHIRSIYGEQYDDAVAEAIANPASVGLGQNGNGAEEEEDELFEDALQLVVETGYASISLLQRRLTIGYPRAARLVDRLFDRGYIGPFEGSKPRKVLLSMEQYLARNKED